MLVSMYLIRRQMQKINTFILKIIFMQNIYHFSRIYLIFK